MHEKAKPYDFERFTRSRGKVSSHLGALTLNNNTMFTRNWYFRTAVSVIHICNLHCLWRSSYRSMKYFCPTFCFCKHRVAFDCWAMKGWRLFTRHNFPSIAINKNIVLIVLIDIQMKLKINCPANKNSAVTI